MHSSEHGKLHECSEQDDFELLVDCNAVPYAWTLLQSEDLVFCAKPNGVKSRRSTTQQQQC